MSDSESKRRIRWLMVGEVVKVMIEDEMVDDLVVKVVVADGVL
jgi:hypothetical protein